MNAEQYLSVALGGNMNISTLKPLAWHEIMEGYAQYKLAEAQPQADNSAMLEIALCLQRVFTIVNAGAMGKYHGLESDINAVVAQLQQ